MLPRIGGEILDVDMTEAQVLNQFVASFDSKTQTLDEDRVFVNKQALDQACESHRDTRFHTEDQMLDSIMTVQRRRD